MTRQPRRARRLVGLAVLALIASAAACSGDGDDDLPSLPSPRAEEPVPPPTPTATLDARDAEAWEEIRALFDAFMETWIRLAAEGAPPPDQPDFAAQLAEYASSRMHSEVSGQLARETNTGQLRAGRPEWRELRLIDLDWEHTVQDRVVPEAFFQLCMDYRNWTLVDADTRAPVAQEPGDPHVWTIAAAWVEEREFGPDGWALSQMETDRSQPC